MANIRSSISTIVTYALTGQTEFTVPFEYLTRKFVMVTLLGSDRKVLVLGTDYRFVNKMTISLSSAPSSAYTHIEIRRVTSATDRLVDFRDGSILLANDMNISQLQTLHVADEARDAVTVGGLGAADDGNLDARGRKILRLADGADDNDAVNVKTARKIAQSIGATGTLREDLKSSAGAGEVGTMSGNNVQRCLSKEGVARGADGYSMALSGAAVRRNTAVSDDWQFVSDPTHLPVNCVGIENGVDVNIKYKGDKIGTMVAGPDESFARDGVLVGGSVGPRNALISAGAPCSFIVDFDNENAIQYDTKFFGKERFTCTISSGGQITLTHPSRRLMQYPIVQHFAGRSLNSKLDVHYVSAPSAGGFTCFLIGESEGHISYDGSKWVIASSPWETSELTFTWDDATGILTVKHPAALGSPSCTLTPWWNGSEVNVQMTDAGNTGFKVKFTKPDGTVPSQSSALGFYFCRGKSAIIKKPEGKLHTFVGHVQVNMNHVDYTNGNFWFLSMMHDLTYP